MTIPLGGIKCFAKFLKFVCLLFSDFEKIFCMKLRKIDHIMSFAKVSIFYTKIQKILKNCIVIPVAERPYHLQLQKHLQVAS